LVCTGLKILAAAKPVSTARQMFSTNLSAYTTASLMHTYLY